MDRIGTQAKPVMLQAMSAGCKVTESQGEMQIFSITVANSLFLQTDKSTTYNGTYIQSDRKHLFCDYNQDSSNTFVGNGSIFGSVMLI